MAIRRRARSIAVAPSARERILATAGDLFYARGIRNVGIDEIIARAGVAKASLYNHFASKDALVVEFLKQRDAAWREWLQATLAERAAKPKEKLLAVFDVLEEWFAQDDFRGCQFINAIVELADSRHPAHKAAVRHKTLVRDYLRDLAVEARIRDPEALADQLALLVQGAIVSAVMEQSTDPARRARAMAARLLAAG